MYTYVIKKNVYMYKDTRSNTDEQSAERLILKSLNKELEVAEKDLETREVAIKRERTEAEMEKVVILTVSKQVISQNLTIC
jgi:hypothetical protein